MPRQYTPRIVLICTHCGTSFSRIPSYIRPGQRPFCSRACLYPGTSVDRFWAKVDKTGSCWLWTGYTQDGYGRLGDGAGKLIYAHRLSYEWAYGSVEPGLDLDHVCHTNDPTCLGGPSCLHRRCVNPTHLEPVTEQENALRSRSSVAVFARRDACDRGHPFTPENTYWRPKWGRRCRECKRQQGRESYRLKYGKVRG